MKNTINNLKGYRPLDALTYNVSGDKISFNEWGYKFEIVKLNRFDVIGKYFFQSFTLLCNGQVCEQWDDEQDRHLDHFTSEGAKGEYPTDEQLVRNSWSWISNHI